MSISNLFRLALLPILFTAGAAKADYVDFDQYCVAGVMPTECNSGGLFSTSGDCNTTIILKNRVTARTTEITVSDYESGSWSHEDGETLSMMLPPLAIFILPASFISRAISTSEAASDVENKIDGYKKFYACPGTHFEN